MSVGDEYKRRWAMRDHDGLTEANLEGARRLGWLTQEEMDQMNGDTE